MLQLPGSKKQCEIYNNVLTIISQIFHLLSGDVKVKATTRFSEAGELYKDGYGLP